MADGIDRRKGRASGMQDSVSSSSKIEDEALALALSEEEKAFQSYRSRARPTSNPIVSAETTPLTSVNSVARPDCRRTLSSAGHHNVMIPPPKGPVRSNSINSGARANDLISFSSDPNQQKKNDAVRAFDIKSVVDELFTQLNTPTSANPHPNPFGALSPALAITQLNSIPYRPNGAAANSSVSRSTFIPAAATTWRLAAGPQAETPKLAHVQFSSLLAASQTPPTPPAEISPAENPSIPKSFSCQNLTTRTLDDPDIPPALPPKRGGRSVSVKNSPLRFLELRGAASISMMKSSHSTNSFTSLDSSKPQNRPPSNCLIDLDAGDPKTTKVSVLEAFGPLLGREGDGNDDFDEDMPDHDRSGDALSESSFYCTYDPFEYMVAKAASMADESYASSCDDGADVDNSVVDDSSSATSTPLRKVKGHARHPSIGNGVPDVSTVERRKRKKEEYDEVVRFGSRTRLTFDSCSSPENDHGPVALLPSKVDGGVFVVRREKNLAVDQETIAFTRIVNETRSRFKHSDRSTNPGLVLGSKMQSCYPDGTSVKIAVTCPALGKVHTFTCDVDSSVEHLVSKVIVNLADNGVDARIDDWWLRVRGTCEYLDNSSMLKEYEYVHKCFKYDKDLEFTIVLAKSVKHSFLRTAEDDQSDSRVRVEDLNTLDTCRTLSYNELEILLDVLKKESKRMRDTTRHLVSSTEKNVITSLRPKKMIQAVKAVCAQLGQIETLEVSECCDKLAEQCLEFDKVKGNEEPSGKLRPEIVAELGEKYATIVLRGNSKEFIHHESKILHTLEKIESTIHKLVEVYAKTFRVNFSFKTTKDAEPKETIKIFETFLVRVCALHRPQKNWPAHTDFSIKMQIFHGTRPIAEPLFTPYCSQTESFYERVNFDSWLETKTLNVSSLPRESRLIFTLIGRSQKKVNSGEGSRHSAEFLNVSTDLCWTSLQLFSFDLFLAQGTFLLPFWPMECEQQIGPAPDSGSHPFADICPILSIELPEIGSPLKFPDDPPPQYPREENNFDDLDYITRQQLLDICGQDLITFTEMPQQDKEILWEKRHYLKNIPGALPKVLMAAHSWEYACLPGLYGILDSYTRPQAMDILQLFLPCFPDIHVRKVAIEWLAIEVSNDDIVDYLPQLLEALKHETWNASSLAQLLLQRSLESPRLAHSLYWLMTQTLPGSTPQNTTFEAYELKGGLKIARYHRRLQLMMRALETICGQALRNAFLKQQVLLKYLHSAAEEIKTCSKDSLRSPILEHHLESLNGHLGQTSTPIPLSLGFEASGVSVQDSSFFSSNTKPLKMAFTSEESQGLSGAAIKGGELDKLTTLYGIYKVGDDLRQDQLTLQMIRVMDKLWLREGIDMRIVTFLCVPTGENQGLIEMVTEAKTLREIQVTGNNGVRGSFKETPVADWLKIHNPSQLQIAKALDNFTRSCAGYSIITYVLGICDRHNDNIMVKKSGHIFHIDFGKFLGDYQKFGSIKRDRTPFVFTPDMAYVINGFEKEPNERFHAFVDLCCKGFNVLRKNGNLLLNLFSLMASSGIPGVTMQAVRYVQSALLPDLSDAEADATFTSFIEESARSWFNQWNFFIHNLAQYLTSSEQKMGGDLLSFVPQRYSLESDGRIKEVQVYGLQKRYNPEKHYVLILKIQRETENVPTFLFRTYKEFCELDSKFKSLYPKLCPSLPKHTWTIGRQEVNQVAERRKNDIKKFMENLFKLPDSIAHSELVYTFFHPMLRDQEETNIHMRKLKELKRYPAGSSRGSLKIKLQYTRGALLVMIQHAKNLPKVNDSEAPSPFVKVYLKPDPLDETKRKTKICNRTCHPSFVELLEYRVAIDIVRKRTLVAVVKHSSNIIHSQHLGVAHVPLAGLEDGPELEKWYPLEDRKPPNPP